MRQNGMPFVSINNCCRANEFIGDCFGEHLLRKANGGAIGAIGASNETLWDEDYYWVVGAHGMPTSTPQYDSIALGAFDRLLHNHSESQQNQASTQSQIVNAGNWAVAASGSPFSDFYWEIYSLLGDPSLMPFIGAAKVSTLNIDSVAAYDTTITLLNAFEMSDDVLRQGVQSISDLILLPGLINLDFADVTSVMKDAGNAHMGMGKASGKDKAKIAATKAISSPLLETSIDGAKGVIINITASSDISLEDIDTAATMIKDKVSEDANIIWGAVIDDKMNDEMSVTVIATGFGDAKEEPKFEEPKKEESVIVDTPTTSSSRSSRPSREPVVEDEDDTFYDIMSIFNK